MEEESVLLLREEEIVLLAREEESVLLLRERDRTIVEGGETVLLLREGRVWCC